MTARDHGVGKKRQKSENLGLQVNLHPANIRKKNKKVVIIPPKMQRMILKSNVFQ